MIDVDLETVEETHRWMLWAAHELLLGVHEIAGAEDHPRIRLYLGFCRDIPPPAQRDETTSWCSAFVNFCLGMGQVEPTYSARARSYCDYGAPVQGTPRYGDIIVLERPDAGPTAGHVGFFLQQAPQSAALYRLLSGNHNNSVSVGDFAKSRVIAIRRPIVLQSHLLNSEPHA